MNILTESKTLVDAKYLEELFTDLQLNTDVKRTLESIRKVLNSSFDAECLDVIIGDENDDFYGMCVYPSEESLRDISVSIVSGANTRELTRDIVSKRMAYVVEIDPKTLNSKIFNLRPDELVAMLLHEIGHVTADTDFYADLLFTYQNAVYDMEKDKSKLAGNKYNKKDIEIAMMYIISSINNTQIIKRGEYENNLKNEQLADKFVVDNGYGRSLLSALDKVSKQYLTKYKRDNKKMKDRELKQEAEMFIAMNKMFDSRRKYVSSMIDDEIKLSPSKTVKSLLTKVKNSLKNIILHEGTLVDKSIIQEGFIDKFIKSPIKVTQADIDELTIQKEMMEDWDDKSILVYKIHKRITQLEQAKQKVGSDEYYKSVIDNYIKQLNNLLKEVMKFKATPKTYGVFIKYPKGYEG